MEVLILGLNIEDKALFGIDFDIHPEIWSLNDFYRYYKNLPITKVFQLHRNIDNNIIDIQKQYFDRWQNWIEEYNKHPATKVVFDIDNRLDGYLLIYPLFAVLKRFDRKHFVNSLSYMLAYAYMIGIKKIYLKGFSDNIEYPDSLYSNLELIEELENCGVEFDCDMLERVKADIRKFDKSKLTLNYGLEYGT